MQFKYWDYYFTMFPPDPAGEFCRYQNQPCRGKTVLIIRVLGLKFRQTWANSDWLVLNWLDLLIGKTWPTAVSY